MTAEDDARKIRQTDNEDPFTHVKKSLTGNRQRFESKFALHHIKIFLKTLKAKNKSFAT